jgi:hypothetical protein
MKRVLLFILIFSSFVKSQEAESILSLKSHLQLNKNPSSSIQHSASTIQLPASSIQHPYVDSRKSPGLAIIYSLLLPGMGELYADGYNSGIYFTIADGVLWGALAGFNIYGNWQLNNYKAYAQSNAGVTTDGKESDFYTNIGSYLSVEEYNRTQELNRKFGKVYDTEKYYWNWKNNEFRKEYREMWSSSENAFNNVRFAAGALILNRLISVINAVRLVSSYNKNLEEKISWNVYFSTSKSLTPPQSLNLNFVVHL